MEHHRGEMSNCSLLPLVGTPHELVAQRGEVVGIVLLDDLHLVGSFAYDDLGLVSELF